VKRALALGVLCLLLIACAGTPRRAAQSPEARAASNAVSNAGTGSVDGYVNAIMAASERSDHEPDAKARADLAAQANNNADACLALDSQAAGCQYGKAVATGLEAKVHPARAVGLLSGMLQHLENAEASDPNYDKAGPARVRALVLIRAPSWPVGPGDTEAGLAAARRAVALQPEYPPNVLALAEALTKTGDEKSARDSYVRARDLALAAPSGPDRDTWVREANDGLGSR